MPRALRSLWKRVGKRVDIVEYEDKRSLIDIDDFYDLCLAEQVAKEWNPVKDFSKQILEEHFLDLQRRNL